MPRLDSTRYDILKAIQERRESHTTPKASPFYKELGSLYNKWYTQFKRSSMELTQKPKYVWTQATYDKFSQIGVEELVCDPYYLGLREDIFPIQLEEIKRAIELWETGKISGAIDISAVGTGKSFKAGAMAWLLTFKILIQMNPAGIFGLSPRQRLAIAVVSRNATLAKEVTFAAMIPFFDCPFFTDYFPPQINLSVVEETKQYPSILKFPKKFAIFPGTGSQLSVLGFNLVGAVMDEFAWMENITRSSRQPIGDVTGYDAAYESYTSIENRMYSRVYAGSRRGFIFVITSPSTKWAYAEKLYDKALPYEQLKNTPVEAMMAQNTGNLYRMLRKPMWRARPMVWKGTPVWSGKYMLFDLSTMDWASDAVYDGLFDDENDFMGGMFKVPVEMKTRFDDNPYRTLRDLAGQPVTGINNFFDMKKIRFDPECVNYAHYANGGDLGVGLNYEYVPQKHPYPKQVRYGHADLAKNKDTAAAAVCYCVGWKEVNGTRRPVARFDWLQEICPKKGSTDIRVDDVMKLFVEVQKRGFNMGLVTYNGFQSLQSIQRLWDEYHIPANRLSIDRTTMRVIIAGIMDKTHDYGTVIEHVTNQPLSAWEEFREAFYNGLVEVAPYNKLGSSLAVQMEQEELYPEARGGKGVVDHPPKGRHDLLQCCVGAYWNMLNNEWWIHNAHSWVEDTKFMDDAMSREINDVIARAGLTNDDLRRMGVF